MPAPELLHSDSTNSTGSDAMRNDDLPAGVVQSGLDETVDASISGIINTEVGRLRAPGLISEGTEPGEAFPISEFEGDERALMTPETAPVLQLDTIPALPDGESASMSTEFTAVETLVPMFVPRGPPKSQTAVKKHTENKIKMENEKIKKVKEQDKKAKDKETKGSKK